jgi:hypothetical protein
MELMRLLVVGGRKLCIRVMAESSSTNFEQTIEDGMKNDSPSRLLVHNFDNAIHD